MPIERQILDVGVRRGRHGMHGFGLAQELAQESGDRRLVSHGTLYKALDRLRKAGLLEAEWEDAEKASTEGRPRRREYRITAAGRVALTAAPPERHQSRIRTNPA